MTTPVESTLSRMRTGAARLLLRLGLTPNAMTVIGAIGSVAGAVLFAAQGRLVAAVVIVTVSSLCDAVDGAMARASGSATAFGALLDSSLDRASDGAIFAALAYWLATTGHRRGAVAALTALVCAYLVSYVRARTEGLGASTVDGIAHRYRRLQIIGIACLAEAVGVTWALEAGLWLLVGICLITVLQRFRSASTGLRSS